MSHALACIGYGLKLGLFQVCGIFLFELEGNIVLEIQLPHQLQASRENCPGVREEFCLQAFPGSSLWAGLEEGEPEGDLSKQGTSRATMMV